MRFSGLGTTDIKISRVCLGTMTWGTQNDQQQANEQLAYALDNGINFIDTAELYSVPPDEQTYGKTETIIGTWLAANRPKRSKLVIASKIAGKGLAYIRNGSNISADSVIQAVDDSLRRLQTDYIDLYQLHWPNRKHAHFGWHHPGKISFSDVDAEAETEEMLSILQALQQCVRAGKIRYCGLSNETPWGLARYLQLSQQHDVPRMVSLQNEFSALHSKDWPYLMEQCVHEKVAYLAWSPLAGGALTGKYIDGARPVGSRYTMLQRNGLFRDTPRSNEAIKCFVDLALSHRLTPAQLALRWVDQVDGISSTIIGATNMAQLTENIAAFEQPFTPAMASDISAYLQRFPLPF